MSNEIIKSLTIPMVLLTVITAIGVSMGVSLKQKQRIKYAWGSFAISYIVSLILILVNVGNMGVLFKNEGIAISVMSLILGIIGMIESSTAISSEGENLATVFLLYFASLGLFSIVYIVMFGVIGINLWTVILTPFIGGFLTALGLFVIKNKAKTDIAKWSILTMGIGLLVASIVAGTTSDSLTSSIGTVSFLAPFLLLATVKKVKNRKNSLMINGETYKKCSENPNQKMCKKACKSNPNLNFCK